MPLTSDFGIEIKTVSEPAVKDSFARVLQMMLEVFAERFNQNHTVRIEYPFVCKRGQVYSRINVNGVVGIMRSCVTICPHHSFEYHRGCVWHPVYDDAVLAAFELGGGDAVPGMEADFEPRVYKMWEKLVDAFGHEVTQVMEKRRG